MLATFGLGTAGHTARVCAPASRGGALGINMLLQALVLGDRDKGACNDYNGFWDLTWLLSGGGSKDSQLFRQQCCKVIYTSKGPCQ